MGSSAGAGAGIGAGGGVSVGVARRRVRRRARLAAGRSPGRAAEPGRGELEGDWVIADVLGAKNDLSLRERLYGGGRLCAWRVGR